MQESTIVPRWFMRAFPELRELQNVLLSDPVDNTFCISVRSDPKNVFFGAGFNDIRQAHHINDTARVHYSYIETGHFNIRIFYDENTEVNYQVLETIIPMKMGSSRG